MRWILLFSTIIFITIIIIINVILPSKPSSSPPVIPFGKESTIPVPTPTLAQSWTLFLTGDIIPSRVVNQKMVEQQDFVWPIREITPLLQNADITFANLEAPLLSQCRITNEGFQFCGDWRFTKSLSDAGVDVVNLGNNHTLNYGWEGIEETERFLKEYNILSTGFNTQSDSDCNRSSVCSRVTIKKIKDITVGFLGYNGVGQRFDEEIIKKQITTLRNQVDMVIVAVHWGKEYERFPVPDASLAPDDPKIWGKKFIDWGADLVAGNHPHWYQPVEWYKGKPIFYALGNTIFDQEWSVETRRGFLAKLIMTKNNTAPEQISYYPIGIRNWGQAYLLEGQEKEEVLNFLHSPH